ncbi:MAG: protein-glutamate O-methyltransferase CheR [Bdellovibrionaceae bacterium]|nr:protein-glutamate O-methyltransferase CheR [Pseudobdellovibrionaceae bacterium]
MRYGYDFRQYAEASLDRRLSTLLTQFKVSSLLELLKKVLDSSDTFRDVLPYLTINTTEFFRDPLFFRTLREVVFPVLKTYSRIVIWVAGCSTGEEVLSLAIALKEENLLDRTTIHATDINPKVLKKAKEGIYELSLISSFNKNYVTAGGTNSPSEYYTAEYGLARFNSKFLENTVFSEHNLVTDAPFIEANLILCRNVLIYFNRELQDRAFNLFARSLVFKGYLGIGSKETLRFSNTANYFDTIDSNQNIYNLKVQPVGKSAASLRKPT